MRAEPFRVFPGSERLRYLIPFREPSETINTAGNWPSEAPGSVVVFGDDGESFGRGPKPSSTSTSEVGYAKFFQASTDNREWLVTVHDGERRSTNATDGQDLFAGRQLSRDDRMGNARCRAATRISNELVHEFEDDPRFERIKPLLSGGFWRNFKVKYPESNEMYARMMYVSASLAGARECGINETILQTAQDHWYQGQCNCSYWHGAFGGIYLPAPAQRRLSATDYGRNLLQQAMRRPVSQWIECTDNDFNFDGQNEVRLANDKIVAWVIPHQAAICMNWMFAILATTCWRRCNRRPEAYHEKVRRGQAREDDHTASIHDRVVFKQEGLERCLNYDDHPRKSLVDHFWDDDTNIQSVVDGTAEERGDFVQGYYSAAIRRNPHAFKSYSSVTASSRESPLPSPRA